MIYVIRNGVVVEKNHTTPQKRLSVISDGMTAVKHMATGVVTDSKSHFRSMTRSAGLTEVGTDSAGSRPMPRYEPSMKDIVTDVRKALAQ